MKVGSPVLDSGALVPISVETLRPTGALDFNLYIRYEPHMSPVLYHERGYAIDQAKIDRLWENEVRLLYVSATEAEVYSRYVHDTVLRDEALSPLRRIRMLQQMGRESLAKVFEGRDLDEALESTGQLSPRVMELVWQRDLTISELFSSLGHDSTLETHLINVCTYSLLLAEGLGINDERSLSQLGQGALLHDLGKLYLPALDLSKEQPMTNQQRAILRQHPQRGFEELCQREELGEGQLLMVYQHHEWINGRGYPVGLVGEELHVWSRICAVANTFDSLTRHRAYQKGAITAEVLELLARQAGEMLDRDMVECWIARINKR